MSALGTVVRSGVGRRRVQTIVIGLVVMIAVTASVLGGAMLVASNGPFDRAFAQQHGPHLTAQFDPAKATAAQLTASAKATGVTAAAGPFRTVSVAPTVTPEPPPGMPAAPPIQVDPMTVVGRADPGGSVDRLTLVSGAWVTGPGQIVMAVNDERMGVPLGRKLRFPNLPGAPTLTVVGTARSVSATADGWVAPAQIAALTPPGKAAAYQMLYRFADASTGTQMTANRAAVSAGLPAGAVTGTTSWLAVKKANTRQSALFVPFLVAFGVLGLVMAVLIVGNVIAGAVGAATHRIGILKALGFVPAQVRRAYVSQALLPAAVGTVLGVVAGNLLAIPLLADTNELYGTSDSGVDLRVDAVVIAGALGVVALTAWAAAYRAGRLRTVDALAVGRTPRPGRGQWAARLTGRLPLPRPVSLGLAHPFARPVRTAAMVAAIAFGATAVVFAVGLCTSLDRIQGAAGDENADVVVMPGHVEAESGGGVKRRESKDETPFDPAAVARVIGAQAGTVSFTGIANAQVTVAGIAGSTEVLALTGDDTGRGWKMVSGRWFSGAGEIVVATPFLTATNTRIGDSVVLTDKGTVVTVRIVGEVFNTQDDGMQVLTGATTLAAAEPDLTPTQYQLTVAAGTDRNAYATKLNTALTPLGASAFAPDQGVPPELIIINALTGFLTLMLVAVACLGVLNLVVLETRERVKEMGIHKALGMTPRQTIAMVLASVFVIGVAGGVAGVPLGLALHDRVVRSMGRSAGFELPRFFLDVFPPAELALFGLAGLVIAVLGALLPASWAAGTRTATALRTE